MAGEWLTTSEAAERLGCSRQHVVNLCESGRLPFHFAGTHRRILEADLSSVSEVRGVDRGPSAMLALWLGRAASGRVAADPDRAFRVARRDLQRRLKANPRERSYVDRWRAIIGDGPESVMRALTGMDDASRSLQGVSPFIDLVPAGERARITKAVSEAYAGGLS